jgi:hypothetical protein
MNEVEEGNFKKYSKKKFFFYNSDSFVFVRLTLHHCYRYLDNRGGTLSLFS